MYEPLTVDNKIIAFIREYSGREGRRKCEGRGFKGT